MFRFDKLSKLSSDFIDFYMKYSKILALGSIYEDFPPQVKY